MTKEVRVQLMPNVVAKQPKATSTKLIKPTYEALVNYALSNIKTGKKKLSKKKIRLFVRKYCHNAPSGTEITSESNIELILNDGILISVSKGENYIGDIEKVNEAQLNKFPAAPRYYILKTLTDTPESSGNVIDIINKHPKENMTKEQCSMELVNSFPILDGCVLPHLRKLASKYEDITLYYSDAGYYSFDYKDKIEYPPITDWESGLLRECRGLIISAVTGKVLARRFHKFFNIGEIPETKFDNIDWTDAKIYNKIDGSLVSPIKLDSNQIVWATRKQIINLDVEINEPETKLIKYCIENNMTPLFEWCQDNRTVGVINHTKSQLILLAIRHNITGKYIDIEQFSDVTKAKLLNINVEDLDNYVGLWTNKEGVVITLPNGYKYKYKSIWYRNIAQSNYYGGNNRFIEEYLKRTTTLKDLPIRFIWKYMLNPDIVDKIKPLRQIKDQTEFNHIINFQKRINDSLGYLSQQLMDWYTKINYQSDNMATVKKLINTNGWSDNIFLIDSTDKISVDKTKLTNFIYELVKKDKINVVEEILDIVWSNNKHVTGPLNTGLAMKSIGSDISDHVIDIYLPAKLSNLSGKKLSPKTKVAIQKGYRPDEGKMKGLWEQFTKQGIWDLRIDLQPHTKGIYTEHNGNEEYALLLVQYGLQDSNKVPKGSIAGILVPVDTEYKLKEYQHAFRHSFNNKQIVKMRRNLCNTDGYKIYCDLDGVLADFNKMVTEVTKLAPKDQPINKMWQRILSYNGFFANMPLMKGAQQLWDSIITINNNNIPTILTGLPRSCKDTVSKDKRKWCQKHLCSEIDVITCLSNQKYEYSGNKHILIDDNLDLKDMWVKNGGIFIHHYRNDTTLYQLRKAMGKLLQPIQLDPTVLEDDTKLKNYKIVTPTQISSNLMPIELDTKTCFDNSISKILRSLNMFDISYDTDNIVGIDFEWNPYSSNKGVSLAQISNKSVNYLIDMHDNGEKEMVKTLLQDPNILKIGFGLSDDVKRLGTNIINVIDIQEYVQENYVNVWNTQHSSLDTIAKLICKQTINKDKKIQMSKWNNRPLSKEQINYAIKDSSILIDIYNEIYRYNVTENKGRQLVSRNLYCKETDNKVFNFDYDLNKPMEIIYSGVILSKESKDTLKQKYDGIYTNKFGDHITLHYKPTRHQVKKLDIGRYIDINVIGYYKNEHLETILVKTEFGEGHITISTSDGVKPKEAKYITTDKYTKLDETNKFTLTGIIGLKVTYIEDELAGLPTSIKNKLLDFVENAMVGENIKFKPMELTATHRAIIHRYAENHYLSSQSIGKDVKRRLIVTMKRQKTKDSDLNIIKSKKQNHKSPKHIEFILKDSYLVSKANIMYPTEKYIAELTNQGIKWIGNIKQDRSLIILRGLAGSGKSTLAKTLDGVRIGADDYFTKNGEYKFDIQQLDNAHKYCYQTTETYLQNEYPSVIVDNTNSTGKEYQRYIHLAGKYKYKVIILEIECIDKSMAIQFSKRNSHFNNVKISIDMFNRWEVDDNALIVKPYFPDEIKSNYAGDISFIKWLTDNKLITSIKSTNATHMWMSVNHMGVKFINIPKSRLDECYQIYVNSGISGKETDEAKYLTEICQEQFRLYFDFDYEAEYIFEDFNKLAEIIKEVSQSKEVYITGNHRESGDKMKTGLHIHCYDKIVDIKQCLEIRTQLITKLIEQFPNINWNQVIDENAYHVIRMLGSRKVTKDIDKGHVYQVYYMDNPVNGIELMKKISIHL